MTSRVLIPQTPKGVEHTFRLCKKRLQQQVLIPQTPKGVEHTPTGGSFVLTYPDVLIPQTPKGVEHNPPHILNVLSGLSANSSDAQRR